MPLHPLVNDAAVTLLPLSVAAALAFALVPGWRWLTRWATLLVTVGGLVSLLLTWWTGRELATERYANVTGVLAERLATHQERADVLVWVYLAFTVAVVLAFLVVPAPSRLEGGRMGFAGTSARWASTAVPAALVALALLALLGVVLTGHAGAQVAFGQ